MGANEVSGFGVHPGDVGLEFRGLDAPLASPAHLDRREFAVTHECVRLRGRDAESLGDIRECQEPGGHPDILASGDAQMGDLGVHVDCDRRTIEDVEEVKPPPARRFRSDRRDIRLGLGVALVVLSVVVGSRALSSSDDRTPVWSVRTALASGTTLTADDLLVTAVAVEDLTTYVPTSTELAGKVLTRDIGAGELIPATVLADALPADRRMVTVPVDLLHAPPSLARGERVDVYVSSQDGTAVTQDAIAPLPELILAGVLVADPGQVDAMGANDQMGVVLDVAAKDADRAVAAARGGDVDLVRIGSGS